MQTDLRTIGDGEASDDRGILAKGTNVEVEGTLTGRTHYDAGEGFAEERYGDSNITPTPCYRPFNGVGGTYESTGVISIKIRGRKT